MDFGNFREEMTLRQILDDQLLLYTGKRLKPSQIARIAEEIGKVLPKENPENGTNFNYGFNDAISEVKERLGI